MISFSVFLKYVHNFHNKIRYLTMIFLLITMTLTYASSPPSPYVSFNPKLVCALILLYKIINVNYYLVIRNIDIAYTFH